MNEIQVSLLRSEKARRDWTNKDLAKASKVSERTVISVLGGDLNVSLIRVARIASALGLTMKQVFTPQKAKRAPATLAPSPDLGRAA